MTAALAGASLAFTGVCTACLVYLHLAPTGYSPLRDAVSAYGVGAHARWYQAQAACAGIAGALLAGALDGPGLVVLLLVLFAAARLAITQFPMDAKRELHWWLAVVAFLSIAGAAIHLKPHEHGTPALGWAMLVSLVAARIVRRTAFGLGERAFYAAMLTWLALVAARLV